MLLCGENGIIKQAQKASVQADMARIVEDAQMAYSDAYADKVAEEGMSATVTTADIAAKMIDEYRI